MIKKRLLVFVLFSLSSLSLQAVSAVSKSEALHSEALHSEATQLVVENKTVTTAVGIQHDKQAAEDLASSLQSINSLSAHFEQQALARQGRVKTESGEVLIKRPNQFRWDTRKPFNQDIVSRDNKIWMVDTDLMQVVIKKQDNTMGPTPVQLLSGNASEFLKGYQVVRVGDKKRELVYTLRPLGNSELFEQLDVAFVNGVLASMTLNDSLGGKRQITFSDVKINGKIDDQRFQVTIPKDFDVIDETRS